MIVWASVTGCVQGPMQPSRAPFSQGPRAWNVILSSCHLEIPNNVIFGLLLCKWSLTRQWSRHWGLGDLVPHGCPSATSLGQVHSWPLSHPLELQPPPIHSPPDLHRVTAAALCPQWGPCSLGIPTVSAWAQLAWSLAGLGGQHSWGSLSTPLIQGPSASQHWGCNTLGI